MHTILGASGQIGREVARNLKQDCAGAIRLVSRNPRKVNDSDELLSADLLDAAQTQQAVAGSQTVYLTAGLPMDTQRWVAEWPVMMRNVIDACGRHDARLVYFDNTYMYPQTAEPQTEETPFRPHGVKGRVRGEITHMLQEAMDQQRVQATICRAPEFYGPGKTQSITNSTVIAPLKAGKQAKVFVRDDTLRTLIYTPDASRAMVLIGNTEDAYGQSWHLPCDDARLTYRQFIELAAEIFGTAARYRVLKPWQLRLAGLFSAQVRDAAELLPRYAVDNLFVSDKFKQRFPAFRVTPIREGLQAMALEG
ncbi:MAG: NAD-dependent epimerase/dehydratase family protein [Algiphilus sp.]|uniref:NAD-dependent epimerase/dehydratase family protein n=1 Tax=Algiphilus sp. TaxID=1872431 RepID=UPI001CA79FDE|nr:NAD-dependent epimerase/dehydratase family protein [Algiphilus sp.]MBY8965218.1 NAD-dependent epimerase/dehydratase family protein [Algiphilus acroporae]MCI5104809.1 NAD-dependent epimerase/dehydratase family protein [Algiphilus sp.]